MRGVTAIPPDLGLALFVLFLGYDTPRFDLGLLLADFLNFVRRQSPFRRQDDAAVIALRLNAAVKESIAIGAVHRKSA